MIIYIDDSRHSEKEIDNLFNNHTIYYSKFKNAYEATCREEVDNAIENYISENNCNLTEEEINRKSWDCTNELLKSYEFNEAMKEVSKTAELIVPLALKKAMKEVKRRYFIGEDYYDQAGYKAVELTNEEALNIAARIDLESGFGFIDKNGAVYKQETDQGFVYKNYNAYKEKSEKVPCYVSEKGDIFYYKDFLKECGGNIRYADFVFDTVDWQSPGALAGDLSSDSISYPEFFDKNGNILPNE